jgi:ribosomal protein S6
LPPGDFFDSIPAMVEENHSEQEREYEIGYLMAPLIPSESLDEAIGSVFRERIEVKGGVVFSSMVPKLITLSYPIHRQTPGGKTMVFREAYFGFITSSLLPSALVAVSAEWQRDDRLIRWLTIQLEREKRLRQPIRPRLVRKPTAIAHAGPKLTAEEIDKEIDEMLTTTSAK